MNDRTAIQIENGFGTFRVELNRDVSTLGDVIEDLVIPVLLGEVEP